MLCVVLHKTYFDDDAEMGEQARLVVLLYHTHAFMTTLAEFSRFSAVARGEVEPPDGYAPCVTDCWHWIGVN